MTESHVKPDTLENYYDALMVEAKAYRKLAMAESVEASGVRVSPRHMEELKEQVTRCRKATDATFSRLSLADQLVVTSRLRNPQTDV